MSNTKETEVPASVVGDYLAHLTELCLQGKNQSPLTKAKERKSKPYSGRGTAETHNSPSERATQILAKRRAIPLAKASRKTISPLAENLSTQRHEYFMIQVRLAAKERLEELMGEDDEWDIDEADSDSDEDDDDYLYFDWNAIREEVRRREELEAETSPSEQPVSGNSNQSVSFEERSMISRPLDPVAKQLEDGTEKKPKESARQR